MSSQDILAGALKSQHGCIFMRQNYDLVDIFYSPPSVVRQNKLSACRVLGAGHNKDFL